MSPMSEAKKRANKKWNDANMKERYDRVQLVLPKGRKAELQAAAERHGQSVNGLINGLIDKWMERERSGAVPGDLRAGDVDAEDTQRMTESATEGGGGSDDEAGVISIISDGESTPQAAVGVSPTPGTEPALPELPPEEAARNTEADSLPF